MTVTEIDIREFQPADAEAFRRLNKEWITQFFTIEEQDRLVLEDPERHILEPGGRIFFAFAADQAVGCCALIPLAQPGVFELAKMAVSPEWQGCGIGRRILEYTIRQARTMGAKSLHLESNSALANAIHLYESLGFVHQAPESHPPSPYARANVFMDLELT